ncbi:C-type mannose receptor 2-like [Protopterus annectens]|uniref:C-type mannose receptor 2-like n=1 Tax=Protopterus annectens TaxID=7888 RepID=UPI001CF941DB|nr:C-type mannose receptor 2-like [Protopterus annectens]
MRNPALSLLIITDVLLASTIAKLHYIVNQQLNSWPDAQKICRANYTELVSIQSKEDMTAILEKVGNIPSFFWIGLHWNATAGQWHWSNTDHFMYFGWDDGEAHFKNGGEGCAYITASGIWYNHNCYDFKAFFCSKEDQMYFVTEPQMWYAAQSWCLAQGANLVTIVNEIQNSHVTSVLANYDYTEAWIGLYLNDTTHQWQWIDGTFFFQNWDCSFPKSVNISRCTILQNDGTKHGLWYNVHCSNTRLPSICYQEIPVLNLITENRTWLEALLFCRANYKDLVSITDPDVQDIVARYAADATSSGVWIGLRKERIFGQWIWSNGDPVNYTFWNNIFSEDKESDHCGVVGYNSKYSWSADCCFVKRNFICYKDVTG